MKQKLFQPNATPQTLRLVGNGGPSTLWNGTGDFGSGHAGNAGNKGGSSFSWNRLIDSVFGNAGGILNGVGSIVGAANNKTTTTYSYNENKNAFSFTNGTTVTALVIGGVAIIVTIILVLKK